jgi:hypothetical protein
VERHECRQHERAEAAASETECLRRLTGRQDEIRRALGGHSLRVLLDYVDSGSTCRVMLTRDGHVLPLPDDQELDPHLEIRGTAEQIRAFLVGEVEVFHAVVTRVVVLHIDTDEVARYQAIRRLVADILRAA